MFTCRTLPILGLGLICTLATDRLSAQLPGTPTAAPTQVPSQPPPPPPAPEPQPPQAEGPPPKSIPADLILQMPTLQPAQMRRTSFRVDPKSSLKDLLPDAPKSAARKVTLLGDDLAKVPEAMLHEPITSPAADNRAFEEVARLIVKINHANKEKSDHFMAMLLKERTDLRGLPFQMGDACRMPVTRSQQFTRAVLSLRESSRIMPQAATAEQVEQGWRHFQSCCDRTDKELPLVEAAQARVAAVTQMMGPQSAKSQLGMVRYLSGVSHADSTRALAKLALFAPEEEVRRAAIAALEVRRERDYTDILLSGFNYPWAPVARRAAEALVRLDRKDLAPRLVDILDQPDPRAPVTRKSSTVVRELVRINHHRNCLLCHAPANVEKNTPEVLNAPVPVPGESFPSNPGEGYGSGSPDLLVRIDVTYLRQDFSLLQPVADANPWPTMQRFDFLVRERELSEEEATEYRQLLAKKEKGVLPPNHRAALHALRELTGKDAAPTAQAWRQLLDLPEKK